MSIPVGQSLVLCMSLSIEPIGQSLFLYRSMSIPVGQSLVQYMSVAIEPVGQSLILHMHVSIEPIGQY